MYRNEENNMSFKRKSFLDASYVPDAKGINARLEHPLTALGEELLFNRAKIRRMRKEINNLAASHERMKAGFAEKSFEVEKLSAMLQYQYNDLNNYRLIASVNYAEAKRLRDKLAEYEERYGKR